MSNEKDGGPAFPSRVEFSTTGPMHYCGMSLRDWFAGMALQGILSANSPLPHHVTTNNVDGIVADEAYRSADAMLAEREKGNG